MSVPLAVLTPVVATERRRVGISLLHNKTLLAGLALLFVIVMMLLLAPILAPADPNQQNLFNVLARPGPGHLLGTDDLGRDTWARLLADGVA